MGKICAGPEAPRLQSPGFASCSGAGMRIESNHISAVLSGALIALGAQLLLALFGAVIGMSWEFSGTGEVVPTPGQAVYSFCAAIASFALGGYVAARIHPGGYAMSKRIAFVRGMSVWALIAAVYSFAPADSASALVRGIPRIVPNGSVERAGTKAMDEAGNPRIRQSMEDQALLRKELVVGKLQQKLRITRTEAASLLGADPRTTGEAAEAAGRVGVRSMDFLAHRSWAALLFLAFGCVAAVLGSYRAKTFA